MDFGDNDQDELSEIGFLCDYNENMSPDDESIPALVKINGANQDGGFRVIPAEDQNNRDAEMFCESWKDSGDVNCGADLKVWLGGECYAVVKFRQAADYEKFKSIHTKNGPQKDPFIGMLQGNNVQPRKSTYKMKVSRTDSQVVR